MTKKFFLLDTNVIVDFYTGDPRIKKVFTELRKGGQRGEYLIFIPNFCIGEVFSVLASKCYYEERVNEKITEDKFKKAKWDFIDDVSRDDEYKRLQLYYHVELNRYHLFNAHLVYQPAWEFLKKEHAARRLLKKDGNKKFPSTFDLLVIAQGIEMTNLYSDRDFAILTSDEAILAICEHLQNLKHADKVSFLKRQGSDKNTWSAPEFFQNLRSFKYPKSINAKDYNSFNQFCKQK